MKLTEDIVEAMGFMRKEGSQNPVYYLNIFSIQFQMDGCDLIKFKDRVIVGQEIKNNETVWSLRADCDDSASFVKKLDTVHSLTLAISEHYFKLGDKSRLSLISKALEHLPCSNCGTEF